MKLTTEMIKKMIAEEIGKMKEHWSDKANQQDIEHLYQMRDASAAAKQAEDNSLKKFFGDMRDTANDIPAAKRGDVQKIVTGIVALAKKMDTASMRKIETILDAASKKDSEE